MKLDEMPKQQKKQASGLLAPKNMNMTNADEDLSSPLVRVKKHMQAIRERRISKHGT
tara:strand:+ start:2026 stop:2196 length:171 start_codon:yes stop_codon:yes gene_type:complete